MIFTWHFFQDRALWARFFPLWSSVQHYFYLIECFVFSCCWTVNSSGILYLFGPRLCLFSSFYNVLCGSKVRFSLSFSAFGPLTRQTTGWIVGHARWIGGHVSWIEGNVSKVDCGPVSGFLQCMDQHSLKFGTHSLLVSSITCIRTCTTGSRNYLKPEIGVLGADDGRQTSGGGVEINP